jgi:hypothetical protein
LRRRENPPHLDKENPQLSRHSFAYNDETLHGICRFPRLTRNVIRVYKPQASSDLLNTTPTLKKATVVSNSYRIYCHEALAEIPALQYTMKSPSLSKTNIYCRSSADTVEHTLEKIRVGWSLMYQFHD